MQKEIKHLSLFFVLFLIVFVCRIAVSGGKMGDNISLQKAVEIGREALKKANYLSCNEELRYETADEGDKEWREYIESYLKEENINIDIKNKKYWVIWYSPKKWENSPVLGGDATVYIDKHTGEVISVILGE